MIEDIAQAKRNYEAKADKISKEDLYEDTEYHCDSNQIQCILKYDRIKDVLIEAKYFDENGNLFGTITQKGGYVILGDVNDNPSIKYLNNDGWISTLNRGKTYNEIISSKKKSANFQKEQLDLNQSRIEWESLRDNFNSQEYTKACSICFEEIKLPAKICIHCKREFSNNDIKESIEKKFREIHPYPE